METNLETKFDNLITSIQNFRDEIVQMKNDNKKLNDDIQALEKEKDLAYQSFNTDTHILVSKDALNEIREDLEEARSSASYASEEASSARSCAEDAESSADSADEYARCGKDKIDELFREAEKEVDNGEVQS
tara:strand:- start:3767 stop:4162 length:396 start_codon:yes stop_codon:yes gene_type:complete